MLNFVSYLVSTPFFKKNVALWIGALENAE